MSINHFGHIEKEPVAGMQTENGLAYILRCTCGAEFISPNHYELAGIFYKHQLEKRNELLDLKSKSETVQ